MSEKTIATGANNEAAEAAKAATEGADVTETTAATDPFLAKLQEYGGDADTAAKLKEIGASKLEHFDVMTEADLTKAGLLPIPARRLLASLKTAPPAEDATDAPRAAGPAVLSATILPQPPDSDTPWLDSIRLGFKLKSDPAVVIPGIRASLADRAGLFRVPDILIKLIKENSLKNDEPNPPIIKEIRSMLLRNKFAEFIAAVGDVAAADITEGKDELFKRIDMYLWPTIADYRGVLAGWVRQYNETQNAIGNIGSIIAGRGSITPPPPTGALHDYGETVIGAINKAYAGDGAAAAGGLAGWAKKITRYLDDNKAALCTHTGAANEEQLLRMIGVESTSATVRMERDITQFIMGIIDAEKQTSGDAECSWYIALHNLGSQIPWDSLDGKPNTGKKGNGVNSLTGEKL